MEVEKMSKISELSELLVSKNHLSQTDADRFVRIMFDVINSQLHRDRLVKVKGLGTFKLTTVKDRESINVTTGERITIEGRDKITFTPDPVLRDLVNKPFSEFETIELNDGVDFSSMPQEDEEEGKETALDTNMPTPEEPREVSAPVSEEGKDEPVENIQKDEETDKRLEIRNQATTSEPNPVPENFIENPQPQDSEPIEAQAEAPHPTEAAADEVTIDEAPSYEEDEASSNGNKDDDEGRKAGTYSSVEANASMPNHPEHKKTLMEQAFDEEAPLQTSLPGNQPKTAENGEKTDNRHVMVLKASLWIWGLLATVLIVGIGILGYSYGRVTAERDHLAKLVAQQSRNNKETALQDHKPAIAKEAPATQPLTVEKDTTDIPTTHEVAGNDVENALANHKKEPTSSQDETKKHQNETAGIATKVPANREKESKALHSAQQAKTPSTPSAADEARYNRDPRIRTGAYHIVGVDRVVVVRKGQTLASISKNQLGPGMECYMEALNGNGPIKEGQKIKIPKLQLKKRK